VDLSEGVTTNWRAYPAMVCDQYQNLHVFWADNTDEGAAVYYRNDINNELSNPEDVVSVPDPRIHYLKAAINNKTDTLLLTWVSLSPGTLYFSQAPLYDASLAKTWLYPVKLDYSVFNSAIAVDPQGLVHIVYAATDRDQLHYDVFHIVSEDDGINWSEPDLIFSTTFPQRAYIRVEMAIDGKSRIHVGMTLRYQQYGVYSEVGYTRSEDGGKTWTSYQKLDDKRYPGAEWIAPYAFGDDEIHLTWHNPKRLDMVSMDGGKTWGEPLEIIRMGAAFGGPNMLVKDSANVLHAVTAISYGVYESTFDGEKWGQPEVIDVREIDPHGQDIVVCQGNQLHVAYYDRTGGETVWYAMKELTDTPRIARRAIPVPTATPTTTSIVLPTSMPTTTPIPTETPIPTISVSEKNVPPTGTESPLTPLLFGLIPVGVLVAAAIVFRIRRSM
jgi:hypothetical protein